MTFRGGSIELKRLERLSEEHLLTEYFSSDPALRETCYAESSSISVIKW